MMCTTVLHGGVCHRTSTPHKSVNKMKEKKKKTEVMSYSPGFTNRFLRPMIFAPDETNYANFVLVIRRVL